MTPKFLIFILTIFVTLNCARAAGTPGFPCTVVTEAADCAASTTYLRCLDLGSGVFQCKCSLTSSWESTISKCTLKLDESCAVDATSQPCQTFSVCSAGKCACREGTLAEQGECKSEMGKPCDSAGVVNPQCATSNFLTCASDNVCTCVDGLVDNGDGKCRATLGGACGIGDSPECNEQDFLTCTNAICMCQDGLVDNGAGQCRAMIGGTCDPVSLPCDESSFLVCDALTKLCACRSDLAQNEYECQGVMNGSCGVPNFPANCDTSDHLTCGPDNKCRCATGLVQNGEGECRAVIGARCDSSLPCDETAFLICGADTGICECDEDLVDNGNGECRSGLGGTCGENAPPCDDTNYLECSIPTNTCVCRAGFVGNDDGKCRIVLGGACGIDDQCDVDNFAECSTITHKCVCRNGFQDNGKGLCRVFWGGECGADEHCDELNFLKCGAQSGKCSCMIGFVLNSAGNCRVVLGGGCSEDAQCDEMESLICDAATDTCSCAPPLNKLAGECVDQ